MPVTKIKSRWDSGNLIFHESTSLATIADVLTIGTEDVTIGSATNDVNFKIFMGDANTYALFDCGTALITFAGLAVTMDGDLTITAEDISLILTKHIYFDGQGGDEYIVSDTADQLMLNAKTLINLAINGTDEVVVSGAALYPSTDNGQTLGILDSNEWSDLFLADGGVIGWNNNDVTITHGTDTLTLASTWTADAVGRPWGVNLTLSVRGGNYVNAIKGYVDCTTNDGGTIGLLSAVNCEIAMPDVCRGAYYPLEIEWVGKTSTAFGDPGTGSQSGFMSINCSGFRDYINSKGVFFTLTGLTAGTGGMLGAGSSTLRIDINQGTTCYIPLSTAEASYTTEYPVFVGVHGTPITITTTDPYQLSSHTDADTESTGWMNPVEFDFETTASAAMTGDVQMIGVQAYVRLTTGSAWESSGGFCGFSSALVTAGTTTSNSGVMSAITAVIQVAAGHTASLASKIAGLVIQNQVASGVASIGDHFAGILVMGGAYKTLTSGIKFEDGATETAVHIDSCTTAIDIDNCTTGIDFTGTVSGNAIVIGGSATIGLLTDHPIYVGEDATPITITNADYQFSVHTTVDTASTGWFNAVVFDTETTSGANITGNAQVVGVQCYARLNAGSWTASGGLTGISSVLVGTGDSDTPNGILQAMTAVIQLNSQWGNSGTGAEVAGLVIQNQADGSASVHANHYHGIYIYCPNPAYLAFDNALSIQALSANGIYWEQSPTAYVLKFEERKGTVVTYAAGGNLNDISGVSNQGYLKILVEGQTRYIALFVEKT